MHGNMHVRFGGGLTRCPGQPGSTLPTLQLKSVLSALADVPSSDEGRWL